MRMIDAESDEWRQRAIFQSLAELRGSSIHGRVFFGVRANTEAVLEIDPVIFDRLSAQLFPTTRG